MHIQTLLIVITRNIQKKNDLYIYVFIIINFLIEYYNNYSNVLILFK